MFLGNDRLRREMLQQAKNVGIYDLLNVPIVMLMVCTVFFENKSLPKTRTGIVGTISDWRWTDQHSRRLVLDRQK